MLGYEQSLGRVGRGVGGGVGAASGGLLGRLADLLDAPRQAAWNLPGKLMEGDLAGALPGLLGVGAGALAATGAGLPLGLLVGSLAGGSAQAVGKAINPERFAAPTPEDLTGSDSVLLNALVGAVGDPLTFAGGVGGAAAGERAGARLGLRANEAALARGPRYPGGEDKIYDLLNTSAASRGALPTHGVWAPGERLLQILDSPQAQQIMGEIEPGSSFLGAGVEATALARPSGGVTLLSGGPGTYDVRRHAINAADSLPPIARPDAPEILQPARSATYGPYRVEHVPYMDMAPRDSVGRPPFLSTPTPSVAEAERQAVEQTLDGYERAAQALEGSLAQRGYDVVDLHLGNLGRVPKTDRYLVTDAGAVRPPAGMPAIPESSRGEGGVLMNTLLDLLGSDESLQRILAQRLNTPPTGGVDLKSLLDAELARGRARTVILDQ